MELYLTHPYASPLFGDFTGLPPLLIQAGESEVLRDEITLLAHKATLAGVQVMHELYEDAVSGKTRRTYTCLMILMSVFAFADSRVSGLSFPRGITTRVRLMPCLCETWVRLCPATRSTSTGRSHRGGTRKRDRQRAGTHGARRRARQSAFGRREPDRF